MIREKKTFNYETEKEIRRFLEFRKNFVNVNLKLSVQTFLHIFGMLRILKNNLWKTINDHDKNSIII